MLDLGGLQIESFGDFLDFFAAEFIEVVLHDACLGRVLAPLVFKLKKQALGEVSSSNAGGIEFLHLFQHAFDIESHNVEFGCDIIQFRAQVSAGVEISDDFHGNFGVLPRPGCGAELLQQVLREGGRADLGVQKMLPALKSLLGPRLRC